MSKFEKQVSVDDKQATDLVGKNDITGLRNRINERLASVNNILTQVLKLNPPETYQRVQITTLYYLMALEDQLKAQNDLNDAVLFGNPTNDLKTMSDGYTKRSQQSGMELGIELKKAQITIKTEEVLNSSTPKSTKPSK